MRADVEDITFSQACWWQQRVCASCGQPGSEAHHILLRSLGGDNHVDNGLLVCVLCHSAFHHGVEGVQRAFGRALAEEWPEKLDHVRDLLGSRASGFLRTYYHLEE